MDKEKRQIFWDTLCSLNGKDISSEMKKLSETIYYPKFIYRYRPVTERTLDALKNNNVYFSSAEFYDDPFDTYLRIDWNKIKQMISLLNIKSEDAYERFITSLKNNNVLTEFEQQELKTKFEKLSEEELLQFVVDVLSKRIRPLMQRNSYSICFSQDYNNENLWLKYADNHKGFSLVFDRDDNEALMCGKEDKCKSCITNISAKCLYPVYYSDERYDATIYALKQLILLGILEKLKDEKLANKFILENPQYWERERVSLIKHKCHEYDQEWRIILGNTPKDNALLKWRPYGVILGLRTIISDTKAIIIAAKEAGIKHIFCSYITPADELDARELTEQEINTIIEYKDEKV